jgi:RNA polymerase sigma-70 factor, ECF subfamily
MKTDALVIWIPRLRRYARALTGDPAAADDLVQDTLARAVEKFSLWRPESDLRAWLFSIMHNVFVNQLRGMQQQALRTADALDADLLAAPAQREGLAIDLQRCLQLIAPEQREVLLLIGLEEMPYAEAAAALGIPVGTVMSRLSRARQRMIALMNGTAQSGAAHALRIVK